jgi:GT2 family glycosyltransferase
MMDTLRLAVLMTCHNRYQKTLSCLDRLYNQELSQEVNTQVYLVDDGSTDGTGEKVLSNYPGVKIIKGNGNLFWNGGMQLAFAEAIKSNYDYYLWLNDDTLLYPKALKTLLDTNWNLKKQGYSQAIVAGSIQDPKSGMLSYGGLVRASWWHPLKFDSLKPTKEAQLCLTMNGNCVLIPQDVVQLIGNVEPGFTHSIGDVDYGLRNTKKGGSVWIAPGYVANCEHNVTGIQAWENPKMSLGERWHKVNQPKGLPINEWKIFVQRHGGLLWIFYWILPYVRLLLKSAFFKMS